MASFNNKHDKATKIMTNTNQTEDDFDFSFRGHVTEYDTANNARGMEERRRQEYEESWQKRVDELWEESRMEREAHYRKAREMTQRYKDRTIPFSEYVAHLDERMEEIRRGIEKQELGFRDFVREIDEEIEKNCELLEEEENEFIEAVKDRKTRRRGV